MKISLAALLSFFLLIPPCAAHAQTEINASNLFQVVPTPDPNFNNGLAAVSGSSASDIWAVGDSVIHYNGTKWTAFTPAHQSQIISLNGVVDISPTLAWAAGNISTGTGLDSQIIEQWNGTAWSVFDGPVFGTDDQPSIRAMTSTSADDVWAIGSLLVDDGLLLDFLFEHWDGTAWTATTMIVNDEFLLGASADATNDAWAVGFNGPENDNSFTLAMHYNGTNWTQTDTPNTGTGANQLNGVLALAPNNVWAVGFSTPTPPPAEDATLTLIEHYDGTRWSIVPSPNVGPTSVFESNRLFGLAANSPSDIWAFGSYEAADGSGHQMTLLLHYNGMDWTIAPSPNPTEGGFLSDLLIAGTVPTPGNVWIVGDEDEAPHGGSLAIHAANASNPE